MKQITIDVSEETYTSLERTATAKGQTIDAWLLERLQRLALEPPPPVEPFDADEPAFWHLPDIDAEWEAIEADSAHKRNGTDARAATTAMLRGWFGGPMTAEEAKELASATDIHQWNIEP